MIGDQECIAQLHHLDDHVWHSDHLLPEDLAPEAALTRTFKGHAADKKAKK